MSLRGQSVRYLLEFALKLCFVEKKKRLHERVNLMNVLAMLFLVIKKVNKSVKCQKMHQSPRRHP